MVGKLVILEGNISAGKSTLCRDLADILRYKVFYEPTAVNPYLEKFYAEPKKYALLLQLWMLRQRYQTYISAMKMVLDTDTGVILDRSIFSDYVFALKNRMDGNISEEGFQYYLQLRQKMLGRLPLPHAVIYLDVPPAVCYKRVHSLRCRDCESGIPLEYLTGLDICYKELLHNLSERGVNVLQYPWAEFGNVFSISRDILKLPTPSVEAWSGLSEEELRNIVKDEKLIHENMSLDYTIPEAVDDSVASEQLVLEPEGEHSKTSKPSPIASSSSSSSSFSSPSSASYNMAPSQIIAAFAN